MFSDLAVTLSQRRWSCIVDPALLLLTPFGPTLMQRLGGLMELWVTRSFWRVLDDSYTCLEEPQRLVPADWLTLPDWKYREVAREALLTWERIRARSDVCGLRFRYIGDSLSLSALPEKHEPDLIQRFEALEAALHGALGEAPETPTGEGFDARLTAIDALALGSTLSPAFILTMAAGEPMVPAPAAALGNPSTIPFNQIDIAQDALARLEREEFFRLLVHAGVSPLTWAGLKLAVAHVVAPRTLQLRTPFDDMMGMGEEATDAVAGEPVDVPGTGGKRYWRDASVFWYPL